MTRISILICSFALATAAFAGNSSASDGIALCETSPLSRQLTVPTIRASGVFFDAYVGTPTYGSETVPFLTVNVRVTAGAFPGVERSTNAFALVPRSDGAGIYWQRVDLMWTESALDVADSGKWTAADGEIACKYPVYVFKASNIQLAAADRAPMLANGIAVGFDTPAGTVWAQEQGHNFPASKSAP